MAHVLGTAAVLAAVGAGAQTTLDCKATPEKCSYAAEALTGKGPYSIMASDMGTIVMDVEVDTILQGEHYLVLDFGDAKLTRGLPETPYAEVGADTAGTAGDQTGTTPVKAVNPMVGTGVGFRFYHITESTEGTTSTPGTLGVITNVAPNPAVARAYRGDESDETAVYKIGADDTDIAIDSHIRLELGTDVGGAGVTTAAGYLAVPAGAGSYAVDVYLYEDLGDARSAARGSPPGNSVFHKTVSLFSVASVLEKPEVDPRLATADVAHEDGPFLGFEPNAETMTTKDVGILAMITLKEKAETQFLSPAGKPLAAGLLSGADVKVTAPVGAFGFGKGAGTGSKGELEMKGDNPATEMVEKDFVLNVGGPPKAFMISTSVECGDNPLTLSVAGATPNSRVPINPKAKENPTFSAEAIQGDKAVTGKGPFYFCVLVEDNQVPIGARGDMDLLDAYTIEVTPKAAAHKGPVETSVGGAIDRNGTTLNITYLSDHPAYNQRLVIVNRGMRPAEYRMDTYQTETDRIATGDISGTVAPGSRQVVRVQDVLTVTDAEGMPVTTAQRASGTLTLTSPERDIDVMTLQVHPGTGQIDTTIYQHNQ